MAKIETHGLRRTVGVGGLFATAYGNVGSSIYYALGLVAFYALGLTPVIFMLAGGLFALTAKTYAEGASMFPEAGGSSSFARHAFNELVSFFAGWALSLDYILTIAISAFFVPHYLSAFWPALKHPPGDVIGGLIVVAALAVLNIRGIGESAKLNFVLAVMDLATQVLIIAIGAVLILNPSLLVHQVHLGSVPSWNHTIFALSLAMLAYTGIETVSNMAEEARDPGRDVPRAVNLILIAVLGVYAGMTVVALSALPVHGSGSHAFTSLGSTYQNDPVLGIIQNLGLGSGLQHVLRYYVGVLAATILFIATNAGLIGISRLSWSLAEHRQLPGIFARLHPRYRTPWFTIVFFSTFAGLLLIPGQTDFLGNLYSYGAMLSFTTAHVAVIALRVKDPGRERPYRIRVGIPFRGGVIPVSAVLGGIGTLAAWISVMVLHVDARYVGTGWMVFGLAGYVVYRRREGFDLTSHHRIPHRERPAFFIELDYRSAVVPIFGTDVDASSLRAAAKLVGERAMVEAVYVLRVPNQLSLDAGLEEEEQRGLGVLESAKVTGRKAGLKVQTRLIRTRNPGAAIVDEAERVQAEIIYLGTAHAPPSERALGPTANYLLAHRPCRVVIESAPVDGAGSRASTREPVSHARLSPDEPRPVDRLDLAPQVRDVRPKHLSVVAVATSQNRHQQIAVGHQPASAQQQLPEQVELGGGEMHLLSCYQHNTACQVDLESVGGDHRVIGPGAHAPQVRLQSSDKLARSERLGHVVVGPRGQCANLGVLVADGGEHYQWHAGPFPQPAADLRTVAVGKHQVDDPRVRPPHRGCVERLLGRRGRDRLVAGFPQDHAERPQDLLLVVTDEHPRSGRVGHAGTIAGGCATASETTKLVPWPGSDSTEIVPPFASTKPLAIERPRPEPVHSRATAPSEPGAR